MTDLLKSNQSEVPRPPAALGASDPVGASGPDIGPAGRQRAVEIAERLDPPRPILKRPVVERWYSALAWIGLSRLVAAALSVLVIVIGLWWLLRAPRVPAEQLIPPTDGSGPTSTLTAVPSSAAATVLESNVGAETVTVHVAGHVVRPGVYQLPAAARVVDAIAAAGGTAVDGDTEALNLAAQVADGVRIYVPAVGEVDPAAVIDAPAIASQPNSGPININTADRSVLETLPGVGPATAAAIIEDRERNGPFASVDDLDRVPGIGPAKLASLRDLVVT